MLLSEIKTFWISFFKKNGYLELKDLSLIPDKDDNSILWVNSGVSAIKKYFIDPILAPSNNMVNSQRVIRTNDIDRIDKNSYHQTLFEMLGCFSIDGNFKSNLIPLIWDFFVSELYLQINPQNLFITVFENDIETFEIWNNQPNIVKQNIKLCNKESNFWDMGEGPCGPNTEIYYCFDLKKNNSENIENIDLDSKNFLEIANLVFSDSYHKGSEYIPLKKKCVDVGVGLERVAVVVQKVFGTFQIDIWKKPLNFLEKTCVKKNINFEENQWIMNVIVDHLRTFIISVFDGVLPNSKHRGYVMKKLLKRSFLNSYLLGINTEELLDLSSIIIDSNSQFSDLVNKKRYILEVVCSELNNLSKNFLSYENELSSYLEKKLKISSEIVFFWYDTKGIPIEFIKYFLHKKKLKFDENKFEKLLEKQKKLGHSERKKKKISVF